jgi:hypothetical protein
VSCNNVFSAGLLFEQALYPLEFLFSNSANVFNLLLLVKWEGVKSQERELICDINLVIATLHECFIGLGSKFSVGRMVLEPEIKHELVVIFSLFS